MMLTMPNLVHRQLLRPIELAVASYGIFFQEKPDLVTGVEEIIVPNVGLLGLIRVSCDELGLARDYLRYVRLSGGMSYAPSDGY